MAPFNTDPKVALDERRDTLAKVEQQAAILAEQIRQSKYFMVFTGAGISTSAGIPDYRGPEGAWTLKARGRERTGKVISTLQAIPTPTHMALVVELQNRGILKCLVSQNCDGLHRRSGILPETIAELHGNNNRECCKKCEKEYIRDFVCLSPNRKSLYDHRSGRKCDLCGGLLYDNIIEFGELLPGDTLDKATDAAKEADFCLVLGSSLTVTPARDVPEIVGQKRRAKLAICNLQETPLDVLANTRVFSETDILMTKVMDSLELPIPTFILRRRLVIKHEIISHGQHQFTVGGVDVDSTPALFLQSVKLEAYRRVARADPFVFTVRNTLFKGDKLDFTLVFMGHYNEPDLTVAYEHRDNAVSQSLFDLHYHPQTGIWTTIKVEE